MQIIRLDSGRVFLPNFGDSNTLLNNNYVNKEGNNMEEKKYENESTCEELGFTVEDFMDMNRIVDYKIAKDENGNDKYVILIFDDGDKRKATCLDGDTFDFERGVEVAMFKHMFGKSGYHALLRDCLKQIKTLDFIKEDIAKHEAEEKEREEKARARKIKRAQKRRAKRVAEMKEAYLSALQEYNSATVGKRIPFDSESVCEREHEPDSEHIVV